MTPTDRLIVALDVPGPDAGRLFARLNRELGLIWFKVNAATLIEWGGRALIEDMQRYSAKIMLDLKVYDIGSMVERVVREAHAMGVDLLTIHVDCVYPAMQVEHRPNILAVGPLTSNGPGGAYSSLGVHGDGLVCHPASARYHRKWYPNKLIVCPGIRPGLYGAGDHVHPMTPAEAVRRGADMIVVGRPITQSADPVAAARAIMEEITDDPPIK